MIGSIHLKVAATYFPAVTFVEDETAPEVVGWARFHSGFPFLKREGAYLVGGLLPGEIPYNRKHQYRCFLCDEVKGIFEQSNYYDKSVCHGCVRRAVGTAIRTKETSNG